MVASVGVDEQVRLPDYLKSVTRGGPIWRVSGTFINKSRNRVAIVRCLRTGTQHHVLVADLKRVWRNGT